MDKEDARKLNPDEYLNCDLKALVHGGKPARNQDELESKVRGSMMKSKRQLGSLARLSRSSVAVSFFRTWCEAV